MNKQSNKLTDEEKDYVMANHSSISIRTMAYNLRVSPYYIQAFMVEEKLSFNVKRKNRAPKIKKIPDGMFDVKSEDNWLI